jgi:hypothetical protein
VRYLKQNGEESNVSPISRGTISRRLASVRTESGLDKTTMEPTICLNSLVSCRSVESSKIFVYISSSARRGDISAGGLSGTSLSDISGSNFERFQDGAPCLATKRHTVAA